jgi:uncharacterized protein (DUF362 family)
MLQTLFHHMICLPHDLQYNYKSGQDQMHHESKEEFMSKPSYQSGRISRRDFLKAGVIGTSALLAACTCPDNFPICPKKPVVSIVNIRNGNIGQAVQDAINLLGGIEKVTAGKNHILVKPNLVGDSSHNTTKPEVVGALVSLMKGADKEVGIGEGSAVAGGFGDGRCYIKQPDSELDAMQQCVFDRLRYTALDVPLINLHTGDTANVNVPNGLAYKQLTIRRLLTEIDLLCSVPMMKTHNLASVTLGMKNLIGLYPGQFYGSLRSGVHDHAWDNYHSPGLAFEIIDMVRVNKLGLVVIDGSTAMVGDGPANGTPVPLNIIIAGTNPLATDMVAASVFGYEPDEVPHFKVAHSVGMTPYSLDAIEVKFKGTTMDALRGILSTIENVKPDVRTWQEHRDEMQYHECPEQPTGRCHPRWDFPTFPSP